MADIVKALDLTLCLVRMITDAYVDSETQAGLRLMHLPTTENRHIILTRWSSRRRLTLTQILGDFINVLEAAHLHADHVHKVLDQAEKLLNTGTHLR